MTDTQNASQFPLITRVDTNVTSGNHCSLISCFLHHNESVPISQELMNKLALQVGLFIEGWTRR